MFQNEFNDLLWHIVRNSYLYLGLIHFEQTQSFPVYHEELGGSDLSSHLTAIPSGDMSHWHLGGIPAAVSSRHIPPCSSPLGRVEKS